MSDSSRIDSTRLQRMARAYCDSALLWAALDLALFSEVNGGAADVPAYQSRPPAPEHRAERAPERVERTSERSPSRARSAASRDALFDAPYEPSTTPTADSTPALAQPGPKKQVAALFRRPVKPDSVGQ